MEFEVIIENGSWPLRCTCCSPSDVFRCLLEADKRMTHINLEGDVPESLMEQLPRLRTDLPYIRGVGFEVFRLDEPKACIPPQEPEPELPHQEPNPKDPSGEPEPVPQATATEAEAEADTAASYTGFLHLRCPRCGEVKTFCTRTPISDYRCGCGHRFPLSGLTQARTACSKCGKASRYQTNITDWYLEIPCVSCGAPGSLEYNPKTGAYRPIGTGGARRSRKR